MRNIYCDATVRRKYFDDLGDIAGLIFEGMDIVDACATKNMTADQFMQALNNDIRTLNFEAYLTISKAVLTESEYLSLLSREFWPDRDEGLKRRECAVSKYIEEAKEILGDAFQEFAEKSIRYENYYVYSIIAKLEGYSKLAP